MWARKRGRGEPVGAARIPRQPVFMRRSRYSRATSVSPARAAHNAVPALKLGDALEVRRLDEHRQDLGGEPEVDGSEEALGVEDELGVVVTALPTECQGLGRQLLAVRVAPLDEGDRRADRRRLTRSRGSSSLVATVS